MRAQLRTMGVAALIMVAAVGCGGDDQNEAQLQGGEAALEEERAANAEAPTVLNPPEPQPWEEADVIEALDLGPDPAQVDIDRDLGIESEPNTTPSGCMVAVIMTSAEDVDTYASAGDTVVTNPSGTAGVKVSSSDDPECLAELEQGLATLTAP